MSKKKLDLEDFELAKDKVLMGPERKSMVISDREKRVTAYHEAGHTLVGFHLPHTDPIHKVSIIPRGQALGVTMTLPNEEMLNLTREKAQNFLAFLMGGRCAEELIFKEMTNGASNDIERATGLANSMVCNWGMSEKLGPIHFKKSGITPFGYGDSSATDYSEKTALLIDEEVSRLVLENYDMAMRILKENREVLDRLAEALILWETLDNVQVKEIIAGKDIGQPIKKDTTPPKDDGKPVVEESQNGTEPIPAPKAPVLA
jgi:cell division protease FtsH